MSADKYPSIFSRQMEAIVYLLQSGQATALKDVMQRANVNNGLYYGFHWETT